MRNIFLSIYSCLNKLSLTQTKNFISCLQYLQAVLAISQTIYSKAAGLRSNELMPDMMQTHLTATALPLVSAIRRNGLSFLFSIS